VACLSDDQPWNWAILRQSHFESHLRCHWCRNGQSLGPRPEQDERHGCVRKHEGATAGAH
jgi:hypothetical protein